MRTKPRTLLKEKQNFKDSSTPKANLLHKVRALIGKPDTSDTTSGWIPSPKILPPHPYSIIHDRRHERKLVKDMHPSVFSMTWGLGGMLDLLRKDRYYTPKESQDTVIKYS